MIQRLRSNSTTMAMRFAALVLLIFIGCGESPMQSGPEASVELPVAGAAQLPAGCLLQPADLRVVSSMSIGPVASDGTFTTHEPAGGPALVCLMDASERLILGGEARRV